MAMTSKRFERAEWDTPEKFSKLLEPEWRRFCMEMKALSGEYSIHFHVEPKWVFWKRYKMTVMVVNNNTKASHLIGPGHFTTIMNTRATTWLEVMAILRKDDN